MELTKTKPCRVQPTKEPKDTLKKTIINCRRALDRLNISKAAVIFLLSQVGNEPEATRFLRGIEQDREISDMVYCSDQRLEDLQRTVANTQSDHGYTVKVRWTPGTCSSSVTRPANPVLLPHPAHPALPRRRWQAGRVMVGL